MDKPQIIFEDDAFMVLDKPAGWIVNSAGTTTTQPVVQAWLKDNFNFEIAKNDEFRSGVVHRLDKETSGILLIAKTKQAFVELQRQFKERLVKKTYLALVHGEIKDKKGEIKAAVGRLPWRRDRFGVLPGGRDAITKYEVKEVFEKDVNASQKEKYSLVEAFPETGRTHQIRIHLKYIGHPIVSDNFYAGRKTARKDRLWCPRLFLHAYKIAFLYPETTKEIYFEVALPKELREALHVFTHDLN